MSQFGVDLKVVGISGCSWCSMCSWRSSSVLQEEEDQKVHLIFYFQVNLVKSVYWPTSGKKREKNGNSELKKNLWISKKKYIYFPRQPPRQQWCQQLTRHVSAWGPNAETQMCRKFRTWWFFFHSLFPLIPQLFNN